MGKKRRHSPEQIIRKLEEADRRLTVGQSIAQVCQALEISEETFHRWRNKYGGEGDGPQCLDSLREK